MEMSSFSIPERMSPKQCGAKTCKNPGTKLFRLPKTKLGKRCSESLEERITRCRTWLMNCGRTDLVNANLHSLDGKFFVCSNHFATEQFYNEHRQNLLPKAIPTIFDDANEEPVSGKPAKLPHPNSPHWTPTSCRGDEVENAPNLQLLATCSVDTSVTEKQASGSTAASVQCKQEDSDCENYEETSNYVLLEPEDFEHYHNEKTADFGDFFENQEVHVGILGGLSSDDPLDDSVGSNTSCKPALDEYVEHLQGNMCCANSVTKAPCCSAAKDYSELYDRYEKLRNYCTNFEVDRVDLEKSISETQAVCASISADVAQLESTISSTRKKLLELTEKTSQQAKKLKTMGVEKRRLDIMNEPLKKSAFNLNCLIKKEENNFS